jgi:hypothetical protein
MSRPQLLLLSISLFLLSACVNNANVKPEALNSPSAVTPVTAEDAPCGDTIRQQLSRGKGNTEKNPILLRCARDIAALSTTQTAVKKNVIKDCEGSFSTEAPCKLRYFKLANDIHVNEHQAIRGTVDGGSNVGDHFVGFCGNFDGGGHTVSFNLKTQYRYNDDDKGATGFFSSVGCPGKHVAVVKNLKLRGSIELNFDENARLVVGAASVGGVAGMMTDRSQIKNVAFEGAILCGNNTPDLRCHLGGIVGTMNNATVRNARVNAELAQSCMGSDSVTLTVCGYSNTAGGIVGYERFSELPVSESYAQGNIVFHVSGRSNSSPLLGGIIGYTTDTVRNTVALLDAITLSAQTPPVWTDNFNRVSGNPTTAAQINADSANNYGVAEMKILMPLQSGYINVISDNPAADGKNITLNELKSETWWQSVAGWGKKCSDKNIK